MAWVAGDALDQFQIAATRGVEPNCIVVKFLAQASHVGEGPPLSLVGIVENTAGRANRELTAGHPITIERTGFEVLTEHAFGAE